MKRANDIFVSVNPNSPKKRRQKKAKVSHGKIISFGNTSTAASNSPRYAHTHDENQPQPTLDSPWTPLPSFRIWDSSKRTATDLPTPTYFPAQPSGLSSLDAADNDFFSCYTGEDHQIQHNFPFTPSESPPIMLKLRNTATNLGETQTLEASHSHVYDTPSHTPRNIWRDCKQKVLKLISDASRSPLDLILDILDSTQDEYEQYRLRWFSQARFNKLSDVLDSIFAHPKGRDLILEWMQPHALESVCSTVASEMDLVTKELTLPSVEHISMEFISNWSLETVVEPATRLCPSLIRILEVAAQTEEAKRKNKIKLPKTVRKKFYFLCISTKMQAGLRRSGFSARISTIKSMPQISIGFRSFPVEHRVVKKNDRRTISLQSIYLI
jgi:hypothetical protein